MNKRLEPVNITIDSNMDADDLGHRIVNCVRDCHTESNVVNLIKIDVGNMKVEQFMNAIQFISDHLKHQGVDNCIFVPICADGNNGIKDISIDYIKIVEE